MQQATKTKLIQLAKGSLSGILILILSVMGSVLFLYKGGINSSGYLPLLLICALLCGMSAGFIGTKNIRKQGLINGVLSSVIPSVLMLLAVSLAASFNPINLIIMILVITGGALGGIFAVNIKHKKRK